MGCTAGPTPKPFGGVRVLVSGKKAEDRLPKRAEARTLRLLALPTIQKGRRGDRQEPLSSGKSGLTTSRLFSWRNGQGSLGHYGITAGRHVLLPCLIAPMMYKTIPEAMRRR